MSPPAHGVAGWPFGPAAPGPARPAALPHGRPWPRIRVVTVADGRADPRESVASVARQDYPEARHDLLPPGAARAAIAAILADARIDHLLVLRAGDLLAPGALTALALEASLGGAAAVAGLRVLFDRTVLGLDAPAMGGDGERDPSHPFTGGEVLWTRAALADGWPAQGAHASAGRCCSSARPASRRTGGPACRSSP